jgi:hypothetical protein
MYRWHLTYVLVGFVPVDFGGATTSTVCIMYFFCFIKPNVLWDFWPMYGIEKLQTIDLSY